MKEAQSHPDLPRISRSLLTPGAQPPLSQFGLTLLRHVVATSLRYSLYQLGLPLPESPPVRLLGLRLFLDAKPLEELLTGTDGGSEILAALVDPGGASVEALPPRLRATAAFHRWRLRLGLRRARRSLSWRPDDSRQRQWVAFEECLRAQQRSLGDAMLAEILAVLQRREARSRGARPGGALGSAAWKALQGSTSSFSSLGPLDPLRPSWAEDCDHYRGLIAGLHAEALEDPLPRPGLRGSCRETYRYFLSEVSSALRSFRDSAVGDDVMSDGEDLFFVPFQLCGELTGDRRPAWFDAAVATNRAERAGLLESLEHPDEMRGSPALADQIDRTADWDLAPLSTLP